MKFVCKIFAVTFLFLLLLESSTFAQDTPEIIKIREQFQSWQKILNKETILNGKKFYLVSLERNYRKAKWVTKVDDNTHYFFWQAITLIKDDKLGLMFYSEESSPSRDWAGFSEHYYWLTGKLFFVYCKWNTFLADEASTIERRLYFNNDGKLIRFLESVYKLGTREKIPEPNYMPFDVTYWKDIKELPFYDLLLKEQ